MDGFQFAGPQEDYCVGNAENPDRYRLKRRVNQESGEGEIWLATTIRQDGRDEFDWAIKIIDGRRILDGNSQTVDQALEILFERYETARLETAQMAKGRVPGVVGASAVFRGIEPHPPGMPGTLQMLYVESPWIPGDNLKEWRRKNPPRFTEICGLLDKLAASIDGFATWGPKLVHRDIAPENVMVSRSGEVNLIDFTYARPPNSAAHTQPVRHAGYTAPEASSGSYGLAADRYSFGAIAYFLLSGAQPPLADAAEYCQATLVRDGFSPEVASHVGALLQRDPAARPTSLTEWIARLRKLGHPRPAWPGGYRSLAMTVDGTAVPVVVAASAEGVFRARLGIGLTWQLARDSGSPSRVATLAAVTDGSGSQVTFAVTDSGAVVAGKNGAWSDLGSCAVGSGIAVLRDACGVATAHVVDPVRNTLDTLAVGLDGTTRRIPTGRAVSRVLSVAADRDGSPAVFVLLPGGDLACVSASGAEVVSAEGALSAAACLDSWGELRCYRIRAGQRTLTCFDRATERWAQLADVEVPFAAAEVTCAGHRDGVTIAVAGSGGLYVTSHGDRDFGDWHQITDRPSSNMSLATGAAWRLQLAALVDGKAGIITERFNGWPTRLTIL